MIAAEFWYSLEASELAFQIGATWWFPMIESIHVLTAVFMLGSILTVDLRLMGLAAQGYAVNTLLKELVPWSWAAFVASVTTGGLLFIVQASNYITNTAFLAKLTLLGLAGLNMLYFHIYVLRSSKLPATGASALTETAGVAKLSGALSLLFWSGVMLAGRWIGHLV